MTLFAIKYISLTILRNFYLNDSIIERVLISDIKNNARFDIPCKSIYGYATCSHNLYLYVECTYTYIMHLVIFYYY